MSAIETTPFLAEDAILAWQAEASRGVAPSTASAWREFGDTRNMTWSDLGPRYAVSRDLSVGSGQEAHELTYEGITYGGTIGPFRVRDPLILGYVLGKETARAAAASGYYRHTVGPTDLGQLPSMAVGQRARRLDGSSKTESLIFLETIMPRLALRGEAINPDGSGGHLMAACDLMPHDHTATNADNVTVALGATDPYRFSHGKITLDGEQVFRVNNFELIFDRRAQYAYYWQDTDTRKPVEAPPEGAVYQLNMETIADGHLYGANNRTIRGYLEAREQFDMVFSFIRTSDQDEFKLNFTDIALPSADREFSKGKVPMRVNGEIRKANMQYVDDQNSAFFPT